MARILVVDDSLYQRVKIRKFLEAAGYAVVEAEDGGQGLDLAEKTRPDCILLDLLMPKVSGLETLRELHNRRLAIPVIVHTSDIQEQTRQECLALGAAAFLNKPSREEDVLGALRLALPARGKESENALIA
jgi:CheY-like chemotaxis protein